jgi:thiol-disulfide isomerase/thioredoxin
MTPVTVALFLAGLVGGATALGLLWRSRQGRVVRSDGSDVVPVADLPGLRRLPRGATLVQFSSEVCAPCAATRTLLGELVRDLPGVAHVDVDITDRPDLAQRYRVMQTPTTLILDGRGVIRARIGGAPRRDDVREELSRLVAA